MESAQAAKKRFKTVDRQDYYHNAERYQKNFVEDSSAGIFSDKFFWINSNVPVDLSAVKNGYQGVFNFQKINNIQRINKYFEKVNRHLDIYQYLVVRVETSESRRVRILNKFPKIVSRPYYILDFILKRIFPKWKPTKKIYFWLTQGKNRVLSLTETLGRLVSCGFKIQEHRRIGYDTYIIAKKVDDPVYDTAPTYGPLVRLNRIGKEGEKITVYKMRTMHPYSEYLQEYIYEQNSLQSGGKINNDSRVTEWGKWFRKLWIDELPMIFNLLKGQMKVVGVRPLSSHYFGLYPEDIQILRTKVKPGLVPPFYADMPETIEEIVESERTYIESYLEKPIRTDNKYFFKAMYNIFIKRARSA